jgi:nucleotide-binding universal stress UspA family protein
VCHAWTGLPRALVHADPAELPGALRDPAEELDRADLEPAENIAAEGARLARAAGFDATPLAVREGHKTWRALLEAADGHGAPLVVAGAHGLSGLGRAVLGSASTGLVHHSALTAVRSCRGRRTERVSRYLALPVWCDSCGELIDRLWLVSISRPSVVDPVHR